MAEATSTLHVPATTVLTARPDTFINRFGNSAAVWLVLMAYWVISDVIIAIFPPSGRPTLPQGWLLHVGVTLASLATIWCMHRAGFPAAWDARILARHRLLLLTPIGAVFGMLSIVLELSFALLRSFQQATETKIAAGFPQPILVYSSITSFVEFQYLLLPAPLLLWLFSTVILRSRGADEVARAVLFYASHPSAFLTGTLLTLDDSEYRAIA